jgi:hypothetical protein
MNKHWLTAVAIVSTLLVGVVLGSTLANPALNSSADIATAIVASLALVVAVATVLQSQAAGLAQRQMETVHRLDSEFDAIRFDIQKLYGDQAKEGAKQEISGAQEEYFYRRFFIALENCQRCYRRGLVPTTEYRDWTCSLVSRFGTHTKLVLLPSAKMTYESAWQAHSQYSLGDKRDFNAYMDAIFELSRAEPWAELKKLAAEKNMPYTDPLALTEEQHEKLKRGCQEIVDKVPLARA